MATGWHIRRGYSSRHVPVEVEASLALTIEAVRRDQTALTAQLAAVGETVPDEYLAMFSASADITRTLTAHAVLGGQPGMVEYMVLASGGGVSRDYKERAARAFVREVMRRMHQKGLDINVTVA